MVEVKAPSDFLYNVSHVTYFLVSAEIYLRKYGPKLKYCPSAAKRLIYNRYWMAYIQMYHYIYRRLANNPSINAWDREDIRHSIFPYLVGNGSGFFHKARVILDNTILSLREKYYKVQSLLDSNIFVFWIRYVENQKSQRIIYEENLDPQYLLDLTTRLNPESIAIMRYERELLVDLLLKAPPECRINIDRYEKFAKEYLKYIYGQSNIFKIYYNRENDSAKFTYDYVIYSIRKQLEKHHISEEDIYYKGILDAYIEPTFSQLLANRLGVENIFAPHRHRKDRKTQKGQRYSNGVSEGKQGVFREHTDYDRNHSKFLFPD